MDHKKHKVFWNRVALHLTQRFLDLERESIAVNKAVAAFRQDHGRGIMIHVTSQRAEDGLRVVIRKTPRTSVSGGRPAARL